MATERPHDEQPEQPEAKAKPKAPPTEPAGGDPKPKTKPAAKPAAAAPAGDKPKPKPKPAAEGAGNAAAAKAKEAAAADKPKAKPKPKAEDAGEDEDAEGVEPAAKTKPAKEAVTADKPKTKAKPKDDDGEEGEEATKSEAVTADKPKGKAKKGKDEAITDEPKAKKKGLFALSFSSFSKREPQGVWGIDLGQCALKAIRLQEVDGVLTATAFDYVEHPKILSQPDADPDQLTREALEKFLSRNTLRGDVVCISVPGQSGLARFVKLPPVEEKKIADIVRFEAKQQIPFNLDEVVWDYQKVGAGTVTDGFAMDTEIGLFAMKRDMVNRYLQHFKDVNVEVHVVQMAPLALCNFVAFDLLNKGARKEGEEAAAGKRCVVALDIGADSSNLVITDGEKVIWQRPIPLGGNHFTRALTKDMKLTFAKAEHLKRNALKSPELKRILTAIKPVLNDFVGEVQRSLGFFTNTHRDAEIEYLLGLGNAFRLPGLQKYLEEKLQLKVQRLNKLQRLSGDGVVGAPAYTENILTFGVAYGLALQGLKQTRLSTNLLPGEIRTERLVRDKKPWAAAAAAALLLALGGACLGSYFDTRAYGDKTVKTAMDDAKNAAKEVDDAQKAFDDAKAKAAEEEQGVQSIVAGQAEQRHFLQMYRFLGECVPQPYPPLPELPPERPRENQPDYAKKKAAYDVALDKFLDGHHLPDWAREHYWNKSTNTRSGAVKYTGKQAAKELLLRQLGKNIREGGDRRDRDELGAGIDDLIQFNLVALNMRWCDDLDAYWKNVLGTDADAIPVLPKEQKTNAPKGKGWVVELQGYTWHNDSANFVITALMEDMVRKGMPHYKPGEASPMGDPMGPANPNPTPKPADAVAEKDKPKENTPDDPLKAVRDRISHIALYNYKSEAMNEPGPFSILGASVLPDLVRPASTGGGDAAPGMPGPGRPQDGAGGPRPPSKPDVPVQPGVPGVPGAPSEMSGRDTWVPLGSAGSTQGSGETRGYRGGKLGGPPTPSGSKTDQGDKKDTPPAGSKAQHTRTEFILLFIWHEETPSDKLRGMAADTGTPPGGSPAPGPGPGPAPGPGPGSDRRPS